jgi:hypothetical protein
MPAHRRKDHQHNAGGADRLDESPGVAKLVLAEAGADLAQHQGRDGPSHHCPTSPHRRDSNTNWGEIRTAVDSLKALRKAGIRRLSKRAILAQEPLPTNTSAPRCRVRA